MSSDQIGKLFYVYLFYGNMIQFTNKSSDESWLILRLRLFTKKTGVYDYVKWRNVYLFYVYVYLRKKTGVYEYVKWRKVYLFYVYVYLHKFLFSLHIRQL